MAMYAGGMAMLLWRYRLAILGTEFALLAIALGCFAASVVTDLYPRQTPGEHENLIEDGFKLLGIATWLVYFARTSLVAARAPGLPESLRRRHQMETAYKP